jgi:NAD-dependent deacetylase
MEKIRGAKHCVALTGAGVSTLSGIPDFRGRGGLYTLGNEEYTRMFDLSGFEEDPSVYYRNAASLVYGLGEGEGPRPSAVHLACAQLEGAGLLKAIITQNVDRLHQEGGARRVIEVHGSPEIHYCLRCAGVRMPFKQVKEILQAGSLPRCPKCGRVLKPGITFFGESLPQKALREALDEVQKADLLLILGTSLTVYPVAGLPDYCTRNGGELVIVNQDPTPLDAAAVLHFDDLAEFAERVRKGPSPGN